MGPAGVVEGCQHARRPGVRALVPALLERCNANVTQPASPPKINAVIFDFEMMSL